MEAIAEKKGEDILLLDIRSLSPFADYFVIGSGTSERQMRALVEGLEGEMKKRRLRRPLSVQGRPETGWILIDYGDVIIHLFSPEKRTYYNLEGLWREGKIVVRIQ